MKEYGKDLFSALLHAKDRRSIVNPNKSFLKQLEVYEGILRAFRHRQGFSRLHRSKSESVIAVAPQDTPDAPVGGASPIRDNNNWKALKIPILDLPVEKPEKSNEDNTFLHSTKTER